MLNRGFSGYNTTQALEILPRIIPSPECAKIKYMVLNDFELSASSALTFDRQFFLVPMMHA